MATSDKIKISDLKLNPDNPQKFEDLSKLKNSIKEFPKMMELRPMIIEPKTNYVLGGNKRLICLIELGYKTIPTSWVKSADKLTKEEKNRFIVADNVGFGEWDFEKLKTWDNDLLKDWGVEMPDYKKEDLKTKTIELKPFLNNHILISFPVDKSAKILNIIDELYKIDGIEIEQGSN